MSDRRMVCPGCSCLCDGLSADSKSVIPVDVQGCHLGSAWFESRQILTDIKPPDFSKIRSLLEKSRQPLITGIENLSTQAQQVAVRVADRFYASIDSGWSNPGRGSMASFQRYGKVTATLGEIRNRSDLVVLWFCDPVQTHPYFVDRFVRSPGSPQKRLVVIDESRTATADLADEFIAVAPNEAFEFVQQLRIALREQPSDSGFLSEMMSASYGSVFVGKPAGTDPKFDITTDQWFQLVRSLNDHTRFVMGSLRKDRNGISANNVMTSICGFPDSVRFLPTGPVHNGLEYSTRSLIKRRECDLLVVCDAGVIDPFETNLDSDTLRWLRDVPVVVLSDLPADRYETADVHVAIGAPGWTDTGDFVRTDDVPAPLDAASGTELPSATRFFAELLG